MDEILNQAVSMIPVLGLALAVAGIQGTFFAMAGKALSLELSLPNRAERPRRYPCIWHHDRV